MTVVGTVGDLIDKLRELPSDALVFGTAKGSIMFREGPAEPGTRYGYVFTDDRPTQWYTYRQHR